MESRLSENLVDYFFVCGLDPNIGFDPYEITNDFGEADNLHGLPPLKRPYKPSIIQKFPEYCGFYPFPEDYSITSLCMPDGLRLFTLDTENETISSGPVNHNFIVIREDASRIYGTALLFAEEVRNDEVKVAMRDLQDMYRINLTSVSSPSDSTGGSGRDSGHFSASEFWLEQDKLFTMKAIGVLSQHAYIQSHQSWLYDLWLHVTSTQTAPTVPALLQPPDSPSPEESPEESSDIDEIDPRQIKLHITSQNKQQQPKEPEVNIESYVYNLLFEVDSPRPGKTAVLEGPLLRHHCRCPDTKELPIFELPMRGLLEVLGLENLIRVYSCVLLEYRVVILSRDYRLLMLVADCVTCLLFPFIWSHVYAPILPLAARHFLNAPLPFIMGIRASAGDCGIDTEDVVQLASEASVCYVNIDTHTVTTPDDIPPFPYELELRREITELLVHSVHESSGSNAVSNLADAAAQYKSQNFRRPSLTPMGLADARKNMFDSDEKTSRRPSTRPPRGPSVIAPMTTQSGSHGDRHPDNFIDLSEIPNTMGGSGGTRRRNNSQSAATVSGSVFESKPITVRSRLPRDAGISVHDMLHCTKTMETVSDKSQYMSRVYVDMLKFNAVLRDLFLNHFLHIFCDYEQFIIPAKSDASVSSYFMDRESAVQNFDKASFLSEQPETHISFLSAFLETQMFANFIDMKMLSTWEEPHQNLVIFERKLTSMKFAIDKELKKAKNHDMIGFRPYRGYLKNPSILQETEKQFNSCLNQMRQTAVGVPPHILSCSNPSIETVASCSPLRHGRFCASHHHHHNTAHETGSEHKHEKTITSTAAASSNPELVCSFATCGTYFPTLQGDCLRARPRKKSVTKPVDSKVVLLTRNSNAELVENTRKMTVKIRPSQKKYAIMTGSTTVETTSSTLVDNRSKNTSRCQSGSDEEFSNQKENRTRIEPKPYLANMIPKGMAQTHWTFVNALLQETKAKTKRMVLEKMGGQEAFELGHGDLFVSDIEENTLVAGLCDLLERIWCHGHIQKQGKSALWTHLIKYYERDQKKSVVKRTTKEMLRHGSVTESKGEIVQQGAEYNSGSLKKLNIGGNKTSQETGASSSSSGARSSTPDFIQKSLGVNSSNNSGSGGVSDLFFNWNQGLMGSLGRRSAGTPTGTSSSSAAASTGGGGSSSSSSQKTLDLTEIFGPERRSLSADIRSITTMTDIRTDVGLARAFVRLALEKKLLSEHLKKLLQDSNLRRELYKRHAFLRCEEEREQFLFHLLALQAVEYYSFTNLYQRSQLCYRVLIHTGRRFSTGASTTAAAWFCLNGQHCSTGQRAIPRGLQQFEFENQNLGILTTMRLGHDNSGLSPKWFIEFVLVQNVITGQVYKFPCNHWLGKGIDDGSTERLLVGELIRVNDDETKDGDTRSSKLSLVGMSTPPRSRSPSIGRLNNDNGSPNCGSSEVAGIQEQLGNAVNSLVKYFCRLQDRERLTGRSHYSYGHRGSGGTGCSGGSSVIGGSCHVTLLLCGEYGLVVSMEKVFRHGFRSSRIFQKKFFVWDFLEKAANELAEDLRDAAPMLGGGPADSVGPVSSGVTNQPGRIQFSGAKSVSVRHLCRLVERVSGVSDSVGKDGKFQRFVCIGIRDHFFPDWVEIFGLMDCTQQFYDESSFFRDPNLREFLVKILSSLNEFTITLEPALIDGL